MKKHGFLDLNEKIEPEKSVWQRFVCLHSLDGSKLDDVSKKTEFMDQEIRPPFDVFVANMKSISHILCFPFFITLKNKIEISRQYRFLRLVHQHQNKTPKENYKNREDWVAAIKEKTQSDMQLHSSEDEFEPIVEKLVQETSEEILNFPDVDKFSQELRYQASVSLWSCIETLMKDHLLLIFNRDPNLVKLVNAHDKLKKDIGLDRIESDLLFDYRFDLRGSMGSLIFSHPNSGRLANLRLLLNIIYPQAHLSERLESGPLYELNLKRNLIVHNKGVCDQEYCNRTATSRTKGERIDISPGELIELYDLASQFSLDLASSCELPINLPVN